jgi:hypothetical protein
MIYLLLQNRLKLRPSRKVEDYVRDQVTRTTDAHRCNKQLYNPVQVCIAPIRFWDKIQHPLDGIVWFLVIRLLFLNLPLCDYGSEKVSCSAIGPPDSAEVGDEVLDERPENGVEKSKLCGTDKDGFCIL